MQHNYEDISRQGGGADAEKSYEPEEFVHCLSTLLR